MEVFQKAATKKTPKVILDSDRGYFEIYGVAMPEDIVLFFNPLIVKIKEYIEATTVDITFSFYIYYYNSLSSKKLFEIFRVIEEYVLSGKNIQVIWHYEEDDECMEDAGLLFKETLKMPIELKKMAE